MPENHASKPLTDIAFSSLDLLPDVQAGLTKAGFTHCTPIQALTLPPALAGRDVAGQAQTGTGKTAAFLLIIFQRLLQDEADISRRHPRSLVLAPTRELALQIHKDAMLLGSHTGLRLGLAYGGVDYEKQRNALERGVDILIGTPGRIIDYFKQGVFNLKQIEVMVLDEADRMFDLGFIKDIRYVLRRLPPRDERQSLMFSATLGQRVLELAYEHMNQPETLKVEAEQVTADRVRETGYMVANDEKIPLLLGSFVRVAIEGVELDQVAEIPRRALQPSSELHLVDDQGSDTQSSQEECCGSPHAARADDDNVKALASHFRPPRSLRQTPPRGPP